MFKYYGQELVDKVIHERFFISKRNGFYVECGAFDGITYPTCKFFEESMGWTGMNIEPAPHSFKLLVENRPPPASININCALSNVDAEMPFAQPVHPTFGINCNNGSLKHTQAHLRILLDSGCSFVPFKVACKRFDTLAKEITIPNIDLFVLDVEGHEIEALQGMLTLDHAKLPQVLCVEYSFCGGISALDKLLKSHYKLHSTYLQDAFYQKM